MGKTKFQNQFGESSTLVFSLVTLVWVGVSFEFFFYVALIFFDTDESFTFKPYVCGPFHI